MVRPGDRLVGGRGDLGPVHREAVELQEALRLLLGQGIAILERRAMQDDRATGRFGGSASEGSSSGVSSSSSMLRPVPGPSVRNVLTASSGDE